MTWTDIPTSEVAAIPSVKNEPGIPVESGSTKPLNMTWTEIAAPNGESNNVISTKDNDNLEETPPKSNVSPKTIENEEKEKTDSEKKKENTATTPKRKTIKVKKTKSASIEGQAENKVRKKRSESQERKIPTESETAEVKLKVEQNEKPKTEENEIVENKQELKNDTEEPKTKEISDKKESPIKRRISVKKKEKEDKEDEKKVVRRKSRVFETVEQLLSGPKTSASESRPKQVFIPGVKVSDAKSAFERRSSAGTILTKKPSEEDSSPTTETKEEKLINKIKEPSPKKELPSKKETSPKKEALPKKEGDNTKVQNRIESLDQENENKKEKVVDKKPKKEVSRICKKVKDKNEEGKENIVSFVIIFIVALDLRT